jgi:hypothetical protein
MKEPANADAQVLIRAVFAVKELEAGSQAWSIETEERAPMLPAVNIDVWSKEKERSNERITDNCLGLNKERPKNSIA